MTASRKHSLGGSGTVDRGSIGDRVELDRLWLPSLLHVPCKNPVGAPSNTRTAWMMAEGANKLRCGVTTAQAGAD